MFVYLTYPLYLRMHDWMFKVMDEVTKTPVQAFPSSEFFLCLCKWIWEWGMLAPLISLRLMKTSGLQWPPHSYSWAQWSGVFWRPSLTFRNWIKEQLILECLLQPFTIKPVPMLSADKRFTLPDIAVSFTSIRSAQCDSIVVFIFSSMIHAVMLLVSFCAEPLRDCGI